MPLLPYDSFWEAVALGVDVVVAYFIYRAYRNQEKDANLVSNAPSYSVGDELKTALELAPNKCISYASIEGITEAASGVKSLKSKFTDEVGVARHELLVEHKSKRTQGFWSDVRRIIQDVANVRPFCIVNPSTESGRKLKVEVTDPLSAEYFLEHLPITHDRYDGSQDGFLARTLDRLFGEMTKGYQETERMLGLGVPIVGVGMLSIDGKRVILSAPEGRERYIVSTLSKPEIVRLLRSDVRTLKICFWVFATIGAGIFGYLVFRFVQRQIALERNRRRIKELRGAGRETGANGAENQCVVCMSSPREVVILDCGHVCLCSECALALPEPKFCPICRSAVNRYVPIYIS